MNRLLGPCLIGISVLVSGSGHAQEAKCSQQQLSGVRARALDFYRFEVNWPGLVRKSDALDVRSCQVSHWNNKELEIGGTYSGTESRGHSWELDFTMYFRRTDLRLVSISINPDSVDQLDAIGPGSVDNLNEVHPDLYCKKKNGACAPEETHSPEE